MQISYLNMQILEWYLADLKSTGKKTIETVEKSLTDMFIRLVRIYPCLIMQQVSTRYQHTRCLESMSARCCTITCSVSPTLKQHRVNVV